MVVLVCFGRGLGAAEDINARMVGDSVSLCAALGVSRVARVTGLDRTGVEVACAVRPGGHVLQVTNGKGERFDEAARGALCEAAELWAAERVDPATLRGGPDGLAYVDARDLFTGAPVRLPAAAVHCPPAGAPLLGDPGIPWTTNGMGAAPSWPVAVLHALLETVERHALAEALPDGFTAREVRARLVGREGAPRAAALAARIEAGGFDVFFLDCTGSIALPVAAALLFDRERGPVPLAAGYACRLTADEALRAALLEAAQSRATDVHGAREDVAPMDPGDVDALRAMCARARPRRSARAVVKLPAVRGAAAGLRAVLGRLQRAGFDRAAALDLAPDGFPLRVAKVLVPGFRVSGLL